MNTAEASKKFRIAQNEIRKICKNGLIVGAIKIKGVWDIPNDTKFFLNKDGVISVLWEFININLNRNYLYSLQYINTIEKLSACCEYLQTLGYINNYDTKSTIRETINNITLSQKAIDLFKNNRVGVNNIVFCINMDFNLIKI